MDEVGVLAVNLEDVEHHLPHELGQGEYLAEDGVAAQLLGRRDVERQADEQEQKPPLDVPREVEDEAENGHHERHAEGSHHQHGTWNEGLLEGFVDIVDVAVQNGVREVGQQREETLYLGGHPAQTLLLEVVLVGDLLIIDVDGGLVMDVNSLTQ